MSIDKQILQALGLDKTSITIGIDEDLQIELEHKIDNYLKKIDEENERKKKIEFYKEAHENFKKKKEFADNLTDNYIYGRLKNKMIRDGFIYQCKFCWGLDVSGQYMKASKPKNHSK